MDDNKALAETTRNLLERTLPFLRDEAAKYDDDGGNEPLELVRDIEQALASNPPVESALPSANSALDGGAEAALASPQADKARGEVVGWAKRHADGWLDFTDAETRPAESDYAGLADGEAFVPLYANAPQSDSGMTECGHSKYDPCHNCEPVDATPQPQGDASPVKAYPLWKAIHAASEKAGHPCNVGLAQVGEAMDSLTPQARPDGGEAFGHLYRVVVGADHPSAHAPWRSNGTAFEAGPAPVEGVKGHIQYRNLFHPTPAPDVARLVEACRYVSRNCPDSDWMEFHAALAPLNPKDEDIRPFTAAQQEGES